MDEEAQHVLWDLGRPATRTWESIANNSNILKDPPLLREAFGCKSCFGGNPDPCQKKHKHRVSKEQSELQPGSVSFPCSHGQVHTIMRSWGFQHYWLKVLFTERSMISFQMTLSHTGIWPLLMVIHWPCLTHGTCHLVLFSYNDLGFLVYDLDYSVSNSLGKYPLIGTCLFYCSHWFKIPIQDVRGSVQISHSAHSILS